MTNRYGWVMVALGALMTCVAVGAMFSLAVFLEPMTRDTGWSRTAISSAMTLNFLAMGVAGFGWGALSDRFGPRPVVLIGSVLLGLGLATASRATSELAFVLAYGVLVGVAAGSFFAPMISAVMSWFERHRSLAVSLVSVGIGVAPLTLSPFAAWLVSWTDWRSAQLTIAILAWALLVPAGFFVRPAPRMPEGGAGSAEGPSGGVAEALRSPQFIVLALTFFACCAAHSGPIFHTISYAIACGVPAITAVTVYSVEGLAGLGGRLALGVRADRYGVKRIDPQGQKFDPNLHQAMFEVPNTDVPTGTVVQVVQTGYVIGERVLRPALVGVAKGGPKSAEAATAQNSAAAPAGQA